MSLRRIRRPSRPWRLLTLAALAAAGLAVGAIWTNAFAVGDRFEGLLARIELAIDPPPDRVAAREQVLRTDDTRHVIGEALDGEPNLGNRTHLPGQQL